MVVMIVVRILVSNKKHIEIDPKDFLPLSIYLTGLREPIVCS